MIVVPSVAGLAEASGDPVGSVSDGEDEVAVGEGWGGGLSLSVPQETLTRATTRSPVMLV